MRGGPLPVLGLAPDGHGRPSPFRASARDLNEEHELKRRFGAATINAARAEEQEDRREIARRSGRRGRGHSQSGAAARRLRARAMRRLMLSKPDPALPRPPTAAEGGLTMEPCDPPAADAEGRPVRSDPACAYFRYRHGSLYAAADAEFGAAAATYDPAALSAVMQRHPYHLRTLLQLAQLHTQFAEFDMASSLLSRAMVVLESAWHPAFAPHTGACRLPHAFPENRPVFDILRMHARMLARRGCSSAALAVTTLQLALDPEADPLGALLTVGACFPESPPRLPAHTAFTLHHRLCGPDYYGLRAGDATKVDSLLSWSGWPPLPNLRFSKALAAFHCGRADRARSLLVDALLLLPSALPPLVHESKLIDGGSAPAHASAEAQAAACIPWADILGLPLFANALEESARRLAADPGCAALLREGTAPGGDVEDTAQAVLDLEEKLVELFVARHRSLWGEPAPGLLLAEAAREAADASDTAVRGATMRRIRALLPGGSLQRYAAFTSEGAQPPRAPSHSHALSHTLWFPDVSDEIVTMRRQDIGLAPGPGGADGGGGGGIRLPGADAGLHAGVFGGQGHGAALRGDGEDPEAWLQEAMLAEEAAGGVPQGQAASMLDQLRGAIHNWMGGIIAPANGGDAQAGAADWDSDDGDEDEGYEVDTDGSDDMEQ